MNGSRNISNPSIKVGGKSLVVKNPPSFVFHAKKILTVSFLFLNFFLFHSFSQGIQDSIFQINQAQVSVEKIFKKEEAGMKETTVDSTVLLSKINLSLSELLSENTPVFIKSHGRGALATASFRGTAASHTNVIWNGISLNSPMSGMADFSLIPVYIIDDMNLKHGSASVSTGSGGLGGSINLSNTVDWENTFSLDLLQGVGSYKTFDDFLKIGFGNRKFQAKTRIYYNYSKNDFTFINRGIGNIDPNTGIITNPKDTNDNADYTKKGLLQEVYFRTSNISVLSVKYWGQYANRTIPRATSYEGPDNSNLNKQKDEAHKIVADWKRFGENNRLTVRTAYSGKRTEYFVKNNVPGYGIIPAIFSISSQHGFLNSLEYNHKFRNNFSAETKIDANYFSVSTEDTVPKVGYEKDRLELSMFFGFRKQFADRLNLNLMLRQDVIEQNIIPAIPFFGFDYLVSKNQNIILKGNIARNYHHPSLNDLYWQPGGNPDLKPEEGFSYEMGAEYKLSGRQHRLTAEITAFKSDISNWIIWIPNYKGYWEPRNIKKVIAQGIECNAQIDGEYKSINYKVAGNYAYTSSKNYGDPITWGDESYGKQLVYIPLHSGNIMVNLSYKTYHLTYQHNSYSERFTTSSNDVSQRNWLYPYFMNDLIVGKEFNLKKLSISTEFKIYNLFNETYHTVLYRPMPGRNYMLTLMLNM